MLINVLANRRGDRNNLPYKMHLVGQVRKKKLKEREESKVLTTAWLNKSFNKLAQHFHHVSSYFNNKKG